MNNIMKKKWSEFLPTTRAHEAAFLAKINLWLHNGNRAAVGACGNIFSVFGNE
jgi:hypothetical protein